MSNEIAEGYYTGKIQKAYLSAFDDTEAELVMVFVVELKGARAGGEEVTSRVRCGGNYPDIAKGVAELLGLAWPDGLKEIESTVGQDVPIRIKHKTANNGTVYVNAYIQTKRSGDTVLDAGKAIKMIRALSGKPAGDDVPF